MKHFKINSFLSAAVACAAAFGAPETARAGEYDGQLIFHRGGLCVHPDGRRNDTKDNTRLILHSDACKGSDVRLGFRFENHSGGYKVIRHPYSGKCVHPRGGDNPKNGTELVLYGKDCGLWKTKFKLLANGGIQHAQSKKCVYPDKGGWFRPEKHARLRLSDRSCGLERLFRIADHFGTKQYDVNARIFHAYSGLCVHPQGRRNDTGNDTRLILHSDACEGLESRLAFLMQGNGSIKHPFSGKCFHPKGGKTRPGNNTPVVLYTGCNHEKNKFRLLRDGQIQHVPSGKCIHPKGGWAKKGTHLVLYDGCASGPKLRFSIDRVAPRFDSNRGDWGKLVHTGSGKCVQPKGGERNPGDNHPLAFHKNYCAHNAFEMLDTGAIRHRSGKCITPGLFTREKAPLLLQKGCRARHFLFEFRNGFLFHKLSGMCAVPYDKGGFGASDGAGLVLWPGKINGRPSSRCTNDRYRMRYVPEGR